MLVWSEEYQTKVYIENDFAVMIGNCTNHSFATMPLGQKDTWIASYEVIKEYFKGENQALIIHGTSKDYAQWVGEQFCTTYTKADIDAFEYVYKGEDLRLLAGRIYSQKRNHINSFVNHYAFEYKTIHKSEQEECMSFLRQWIEKKEEDGQESMETILAEEKAIGLMFQYFDELQLKGGGIYIDQKLVGFTIGEMAKNSTAHILIEKCDANIRGLYPYLNQQFLIHEGKEQQWVNREEDMGIEGLRKAKKSYYPDHMIEKYVIMESEADDCSNCKERRQR